MNRAIIAASLITLFCLSGISRARETRRSDFPAADVLSFANVLPLLGEVRWVEPGITRDALKGKTTIVLVYATWCPICNKWSGRFFDQLKAALRGRPVIVLAVNADKTPRSARGYIAQRNFNAPNILHGYHPTLHTRLGFKSNLFRYVQIGPSGKIDRKGSAGMQDQGGNFGLPERIRNAQNLGEFLFIAPDMPESLQALLWPCELGRMSDTALQASQKKLPADQKKALQTAIDNFLDTRLEHIRENYKGSMPERLEAYAAAGLLSKMFKSSQQSKKAKQVVASMGEDKQFKRELAAQKAYQSAVERIIAKPQRRISLLKAIARRFKGTHFGDLAGESLNNAKK